MFVSVLVHEVAHSILAEKYGIKVRKILLFVFGGVSDITEELKDYNKEFKMAAAGPATSFILAAVFGLAGWLVSEGVSIASIGSSEFSRIAIPVLYYSALLNAILGAFNLIPAFPSDGGRILRSILVRKKKDYNQATRSAANIGIAISYAFMGIGFLIFLSGDIIGGIWILVLGWFLKSGADSYLEQIQMSTILSRIHLRDIMNTNVIVVRPYMDREIVLRDFFHKYMKSSFPVVSNENRVLGMVTLAKVLAISDQNPHARVEDFMIPRNQIVIMNENMTAEDAMSQMTTKRIGKVLVCNEANELIGLVSKTDLLNVEIERQEIEDVLKKSANPKTNISGAAES